MSSADEYSDDSQDSGNDESENYQHAKYWDRVQKEIIFGVEREPSPIPIKELCGTYRWVYEMPMYAYGPSPGEIPHTDSSKSQYFCLFHPSAVEATPENICGEIKQFGKEGQFQGIRPLPLGKKKKWANYWNIRRLNWKANYGDNSCKCNEFWFTKARDDNGHPFVVYRYPTSRARFDGSLDVLAKKANEDTLALNGGQKKKREEAGLTRSEFARLGMYMKVARIIELGEGDGNGSEVEGSESGSDEETYEESSDDESLWREEEEKEDEKEDEKRDESVQLEPEDVEKKPAKRKVEELEDAYVEGKKGKNQRKA
ncbi:hypothetical protein BDQ12DRAFT_683873 [Crucibulum laeve]|uniref:Uncharacterized protein n=1 Tax=Crucibulum laeve TaxID=68775 RepID=A0A5C3M2L0_9AGAR|nr:hypothetical protein BDQ12DRAFT_683873 [Crucibulum laeve]